MNDQKTNTKEKLNKDSSLEVIGKISELAIETGLSATALGKFGFNSNILSYSFQITIRCHTYSIDSLVCTLYADVGKGFFLNIFC